MENNIRNKGIVWVFLASILSFSVSAAVEDAMRGGIQKLVSILTSGTNGDIVDLILFWLLFFAIIYLALGKMYSAPKQKNALVVISLVLGLMFSIALIRYSNLSFRPMFKFALLLLFLGGVIILYLLFTKMSGDKYKAWLFLLALLIMILLYFFSGLFDVGGNFSFGDFGKFDSGPRPSKPTFLDPRGGSQVVRPQDDGRDPIPQDDGRDPIPQDDGSGRDPIPQDEGSGEDGINQDDGSGRDPIPQDDSGDPIPQDDDSGRDPIPQDNEREDEAGFFTGFWSGVKERPVSSIGGSGLVIILIMVLIFSRKKAFLHGSKGDIRRLGLFNKKRKNNIKNIRELAKLYGRQLKSKEYYIGNNKIRADGIEAYMRAGKWNIPTLIDGIFGTIRKIGNWKTVEDVINDIKDNSSPDLPEDQRDISKATRRVPKSNLTFQSKGNIGLDKCCNHIITINNELRRRISILHNHLLKDVEDFKVKNIPTHEEINDEELNNRVKRIIELYKEAYNENPGPLMPNEHTTYKELIERLRNLVVEINLQNKSVEEEKEKIAEITKKGVDFKECGEGINRIKEIGDELYQSVGREKSIIIPIAKSDEDNKSEP